MKDKRPISKEYQLIDRLGEFGLMFFLFGIMLSVFIKAIADFFYGVVGFWITVVLLVIVGLGIAIFINRAGEHYRILHKELLK